MRQTNDIYAELQDMDKGGLRFSQYAPGYRPDSCKPTFDGQVRAEKYQWVFVICWWKVSYRSSSEYMRIEYVTVPIRSGAKIGEPQEVSMAMHTTKQALPFKYKEYESIVQRRISWDNNIQPSSHREWPQIWCFLSTCSGVIIMRLSSQCTWIVFKEP